MGIFLPRCNSGSAAAAVDVRHCPACPGISSPLRKPEHRLDHPDKPSDDETLDAMGNKLIPERLGVVAVPIGNELVLDATHGGNGPTAEPGGNGLGEDVERGKEGITSRRWPQDV